MPDRLPTLRRVTKGLNVIVWTVKRKDDLIAVRVGGLPRIPENSIGYIPGFEAPRKNSNVYGGRVDKGGSPILFSGGERRGGPRGAPEEVPPPVREARGAVRRRGRPRATPQKRDLPRPDEDDLAL